MGIDIYARWNGQTEQERRAQITGFSTEHGHTGYLREAYHGGPYATRVLVPESFEDDADYEDGVEIPAATLRERLPAAIAAAAERYRTIYGGEDASPMIQSLEDFVALCERKERETGEPVRVLASY